MSAQQGHLSSESLGRAQSFLRSCAGGCRLRRKLRSVTARNLSDWKSKIRLLLSHHVPISFASSASCRKLVVPNRPSRSQFPKLASGSYESSDREIDLSLECTGDT